MAAAPSRSGLGSTRAASFAAALALALAGLSAAAGAALAEPGASSAEAAAASAPVYVAVPGGTLQSVLGGGAKGLPVEVAPFEMRVLPVTQGELERFVRSRPEWQRGRVAPVFADADYLRDWPSPLDAPAGAASRPATNVSWFVAEAYCESEGARLPTWTEWEYTAAADATRRDARQDPVWLAKILGWYARPADSLLPAVGGAANVYGVRDLHGLVWEWVDDFNALLVNPDSRSAEDPDRLKFCGAGAISLEDKQNYAVLMRIALLSSLNASDSTASLGFRCARPALEKS